MTLPLDDGDMTELVDAQIDRVDLVKSPANGRPFVLMKAAAGGLTHPLIPRELVADLIAKADSQETPNVTDPAAPADDVAKDAPPVEVDDIRPDAPTGTTAESLPGSPDWEQLDGDTAMSTVAVLGRVKAVLAWLSDREAQEAVTGGDYDADGNSWDLDSMACSIDAIISALAGFAAGEHLEAGMADELEAVGKSVASIAGPLAVVEGLSPIAKAGRTLSGANESKLNSAKDLIVEVLNSLPQAPAAADDVTKETAVTDAPAVEVEKAELPPLMIELTADTLLKGARALTPFEVLRATLSGGQAVQLTKAAGDPQLAVFDADGKLIGTIDPAKLSPIATSPAAADKADAPADDEAPAEDAPAADAAPEQPAAEAPAEATIPGTATVQSPPEHDPDAVAKAAARAALEEFLPTLAEEVRKNAELAGAVEVLKEQVRKYGQQPDDRNSPVLNGGPTAVDRGNTADPLEDLRKAAADATTEGEKNAANAALAHAILKGHAEGVAARFTHR